MRFVYKVIIAGDFNRLNRIYKKSFVKKTFADVNDGQLMVTAD